MPLPSSTHISAVRPLWAVEGGRVSISGSGFPVEPVLPHVLIGGAAARLTTASPGALTALVPAGLEGGHTPIRIETLTAAVRDVLDREPRP